VSEPVAEAPRRPVGFASVSSQTLSDQVSREIVKSILGGQFATGSLLPSEKELARQFNVSRPVVREAVQAVAMLGLLQRRQGRVTRIAPEEDWRHLAPELLLARTEVGSVEDLLLELLELRRMVEVEAAALAARRASEDDIAEMRRHLELMDKSPDDPEVFTDHDLAFHNVVLRASGNDLLRPLFEQLRPLLRFARRLSMGTRPGGTIDSQHGHRAVFEAIRRGDSKAARAAMTDHLSWTANLDFAQRELRLKRQRIHSDER
jgi:DNA-binding FadR family transcriptional regulator